MNVIHSIKKYPIVAEPVTVSEAKAWMKISFNDDDVIIGNLISQSREYLENYTGISFGDREIEIVASIDKSYEIPGPEIFIKNVYYYEDEFVLSDDYELIDDLFIPDYRGIWKIVYYAGYSQLPYDLKVDILKLTAYNYQNRGIIFSNDETEKASFPELNAGFYKRIVI